MWLTLAFVASGCWVIRNIDFVCILRWWIARTIAFKSLFFFNQKSCNFSDSKPLKSSLAWLSLIPSMQSHRQVPFLSPKTLQIPNVHCSTMVQPIPCHWSSGVASSWVSHFCSPFHPPFYLERLNGHFKAQIKLSPFPFSWLTMAPWQWLNKCHPSERQAFPDHSMVSFVTLLTLLQFFFPLTA